MPPNPLRSFGFPPDMPSPLWLFPDDKPLKAQPTYTAAKAGDPEAAFEMLIGWQARLVHLLSAPALKGCMFVAPHAEEATGDNAIPQVLAAVCAAETDGEVDDEIVQVTRVFHTGADPMERMALRAEFDGAVLPGKRYVLVDDVTSMGGTLAELAHFIQQGGATVAGVVVLANAGRLKEFIPFRRDVQKLETRYGQDIADIFGILPAALTANEARYLVGFRTVDELRNRLAKARQETDRRLRSKSLA